MDNNSIKYPTAPPDYPLYDKRVLEDRAKWMITNVHDPAIFKDGDCYYIFSTDCEVDTKELKPGIQIRRSKDLINWEWVGYALDGIPADAKEWTAATNLWAPEVVKFGDDYYLYYSASQFGTNISYIGLAKSKSVTGPYISQGEVFKTKSKDTARFGTAPNAIDANIFFSKEGDHWMVYGSFFGGIYVSQIDPKTGKLVNYGEGDLIARRSSDVDSAIEGPYIIYNEDFDKYYLFVSYDSLFKDYNIRVGRSNNITGPYLDSQGNCMTDIELNPQSRVGNKIVGSYSFASGDGWKMPGHNSVLQDGDDCYIVHHARGGKDPKWSYLHVRRILWSDDGWPVASPERYAGEAIQEITRDKIVGKWELIILDPDNNLQLTAKEAELSDDGRLEYKANAGSWKLIDDYTIEINLITDKAKELYQAKIIPAWDWENWKPTLVFTGLNQEGVAIWGKFKGI